MDKDEDEEDKEGLGNGLYVAAFYTPRASTSGGGPWLYVLKTMETTGRISLAVKIKIATTVGKAVRTDCKGSLIVKAFRHPKLYSFQARWFVYPPKSTSAEEYCGIVT